MGTKTVVIVGAGTGIGFHTAERFGKAGFHVMLTARNRGRLEQLSSDLQEKGIDASHMVMDAASEPAVKRVADTLKEQETEVEAVLFNAVGGTPEVPSQLSTSIVMQDLQVSIGGMLHVFQHLRPLFTDQAAFLVTGGAFSLEPYAPFASLSLNKAAQRNLTRSLHDEMKEHGLFVGTITIAGMVKEGTFFAPDKIADAIYSFYEKRPAFETIYKEQSA
ncbi:SDR family NAD(P)-dependent oxidoreductase [Bacillus daqingensis]|uniref:SDR family NAD(P)-dependent oxidoreductase n=1 Tax=Bacillus daqingensis TaxID=872396 RepID=A0ABV9NUX2_9BACI